MSINAHSLLMLFASLGVKEVITPNSRKKLSLSTVARSYHSQQSLEVITPFGRYKLLMSRLFSPTRPERAEALSPGQRPGYNGSQQGAL